MNRNLLEVIKGKYDGITQRKVSDMTGIPEVTVSLIFTGKRGLTIETLCKFCEGVKVKGSKIWREAEEL